VFGGIYYLGKSINGVVVKDKTVTGIIIENKKIKCEALMLEKQLVVRYAQDGFISHVWASRTRMTVSNLRMCHIIAPAVMSQSGRQRRPRDKHKPRR